jgi:hypothetical protein
VLNYARIPLRNPDPTETGAPIDQAKYEQVRGVIVAALRESRSLTYTQLATTAERALADGFGGSVHSCVTAVKLDLEARGELRRVREHGRDCMALADEQMKSGAHG